MSKVYRCFAEKKPGFDGEADSVLTQLKEQLGISALTGVRILHRYDVEGVEPQIYRAGPRHRVFRAAGGRRL